MKKIALCLLLISLSTFAFTEQKNETKVHKSSYTRLGISALPNGITYSIAPTITYGKRACLENRGVDISTSFALAAEGNYTSVFHATFPQVMYLQFFEPYQKNKFYAGLGSSLATIGSDEYTVAGIFGNGSIGYMFEKETLPVFMQLDISKPVFKIMHSSSPANGNDTSFQLSFGLGF